MKRVFGYGIAVLALSVAPALAQAGGGASTGSTSGRTGGSTAGTQSGSSGGSQSGSTTGSQSGTRSGSTTGSQSGSTAGTQSGTQSGTQGRQSGDQHFVMEAARGGLAEVELGQLASQKAQSDQVKQFAQRMVQDHSKANDELKTIAQQKNITLPTDLESKDKSLRDRLQKLSGAEFDRAYMQAMLTDHRKDVNDFRKESQSGKDPEVKSFAAKTLPTLEEHLQLAQTASQSAVGTSGTKSSGSQGSTGRTSTGSSSGSGSGSSTGSSGGRTGSSSGSGTSSGSGSSGSTGTSNPGSASPR